MAQPNAWDLITNPSLIKPYVQQQQTNATLAAGGQLGAAPPGIDGAAYANMTPEEQIAAQMLSQAKQTQADNKNAVMAAAGDIGNRDATGTAQLGNTLDMALGAQYDLTNQTAGAYQAAQDQQANAAEGANATDTAYLGGLQSIDTNAAVQGQNAANSVGQAAQDANARGVGMFGGLSAATGAYQNQQQGIADQLGQTAGGISRVGNINGVNPVTSQAALAKADPNALAMQQNAAQRYLDIASGGANLSSAAAGAAADPQALAAQKQFLSQYQANSNPAMSATERYMEEQARQKEEQDNRASMEAALSSLQARGIRSGGAEIGALLGSSQNTSQNRMLQDMAAQANAEQRAERAQQAGSALAGDISAQSFGQSLDRGNAADQFGLQNRGTAINALGAYAGLGSNIVNQSFGQGYQTGSAADAASQFNNNQSMATQQYNAELQRQQNNDVMNRALGLSGVQQATSNAGMNAATGLYGAGSAENQAQFGRTGTAADAQMKAADQQATLGQNLVNTQQKATDAGYNRDLQGSAMGLQVADKNNANANNMLNSLTNAGTTMYNAGQATNNDVMNLTGMYTGGNNIGSQQISGADKTIIGTKDQAAALEALKPKKTLLDTLTGGLV